MKCLVCTLCRPRYYRVLLRSIARSRDSRDSWVIVYPEGGSSSSIPGPLSLSCAHLEDLDEVYIPAPNLAQLVFVSTFPRSIEHDAQLAFAKSVVFLGHTLHVRQTGQHSSWLP